jgi:hypothetical protein
MVIDLTYGIEVDSPENPVSYLHAPMLPQGLTPFTQYVRNAVNVVKAFSAAAQPGRFLVDTFPVRAYSITLDYQLSYTSVGK